MILSDSLQNLVIDEADLVLSFGYEEDLRKILSFLPKLYQSFLMSATLTKVSILSIAHTSILTRGTFSKDIDELKQLVLRKPAILKLEEAKETANQLTQYVIK